MFSTLCTITISTTAQEHDPWVIGIGFNIVDNSGTRFKQLLNIQENWNVSRLLVASVEKRFDYDYGVQSLFAINQFNEGKTINSEDNSSDIGYYSLDILFKNYTSNYFLNPKRSWFTGFVMAGAGASLFNRGINKTLNVGFGFNIKIEYELRLSFQTLGKFSIDNNTPGNANHLQHSVSLIKWL
ncbi:hypothetical protein [Maribacter sp. 2307UL18-2]|uniref:hypothetical protein n=1 Tax=Maribacter sp. 2307UL18-2 TaxID=3386274 RepID=UPI0039BCC018